MELCVAVRLYRLTAIPAIGLAQYRNVYRVSSSFQVLPTLELSTPRSLCLCQRGLGGSLLVANFQVLWARIVYLCMPCPATHGVPSFVAPAVSDAVATVPQLLSDL